MLFLIGSGENSLENPIGGKKTRELFFITLLKVTVDQPQKSSRFKLLSNLHDIIIL
jgi:hypothetical protein